MKSSTGVLLARIRTFILTVTLSPFPNWVDEMDWLATCDPWGNEIVSPVSVLMI